MSKTRSIEVNELLQQALSIIKKEITKIEKNQVDQLIDRTAAMTLNDYLRTLLTMKREVRADNMEEQLEDLDDQEMAALAKQAATFLKGKVK